MNGLEAPVLDVARDEREAVTGARVHDPGQTLLTRLEPKVELVPDFAMVRAGRLGPSGLGLAWTGAGFAKAQRNRG